MAAVGELGATQWVTQRFRPHQRQGLGVCTQCRFAGGIHLALWPGRKLCAHGVEIGFDVVEFLGAQDVFENVEAVFRIGCSYRFCQRARLSESQRTPVRQRQRGRLAFE